MPERILNKAKMAVLTEAEKAEGRASIMSFVTTYPMEAVAPSEIAPPGAPYKPANLLPVPSPFSFGVRVFFSRIELRKLVPVALAVIILFTGGTSYAASMSLPGDFLYSFKRNVNEAAESLLAFGAGASARVEAEHASNRLIEAEELASQGRLDPVTQMELQSSFEDSAENVALYSSDLKKEGKVEAADRANSKFQATLALHEESLSRFASSTQAGTTSLALQSRSSLQGILGSVSSYLSVTAKNRADSKVVIVKSDGQKVSSSTGRVWKVNKSAKQDARIEVTSGAALAPASVSVPMVMSATATAGASVSASTSKKADDSVKHLDDLYQKAIERAINNPYRSDIKPGGASIKGSSGTVVSPAVPVQVIQQAGSKLGL